MLSFHNDPAVKQKYLSRVIAHAAADRLIKGVGWDSGKGCAIGCTLEAYDHSRYPVELGLPEWLARLEDRIFEGLPVAEAMTWPQRFLEAVPVGVDVEVVRHQLAILRIDRLIAIQNKLASEKHGYGVSEAIELTLASLVQVRRCHEAEMGGNVCDVSARSAAWSAARSAASAAWSAARSAESAASAAWSAARSAESAARSAASAAWSAARSAESAARSAESAARSAAWSAESAARSAESAARSAAWSAESAARSAESAESAASAAWSAAYIQESEDLLALLRACK